MDTTQTRLWWCSDVALAYPVTETDASRRAAQGPSHCCSMPGEQGRGGTSEGCLSGNGVLSAHSTPGKTPHNRILNVTDVVDAKNFKYPGSKANGEAGFTHLLPTCTIYTGMAISETQGGIFLFLTACAGIKMFLFRIATIAWEKRKIPTLKEHISFDPSYV